MALSRRTRLTSLRKATVEITWISRQLRTELTFQTGQAQRAMVARVFFTSTAKDPPLPGGTVREEQVQELKQHDDAQAQEQPNHAEKLQNHSVVQRLTP